MASFSLVPRFDREQDGTCPVTLRITHKRVRRYIQLDVRIRPAWWSKARERVRRSAPNANAINEYLSQEVARAEAALNTLTMQGVVITADRVRQEIEKSKLGKGAEDFTAFARDLLADYEHRGQFSTARYMRVSVDRFEHFAGHVAFGEVTVELIRRFETYLLGTAELKRNTVNKYIAHIRTIFRQGMKEGRADPARDPFRFFSMKHEPTRKPRLTRRQFETMETLHFTRPEIEETRHWFLLMVYLSGMRWSDLATLRRDEILERDGERWLSYTMRKTGRRHVVYVPEKAWRIIERYAEHRRGPYLLPILDGRDTSDAQALHRAIDSTRARAWRWLARIGKRLGLSWKLGPHAARHTFASLADEVMQDPRALQIALNHSDPRQTERYLAELNPERLARAMRDVF